MKVCICLFILHLILNNYFGNLKVFLMSNLMKVIFCSFVCLFLAWSSAYPSVDERALLSERPKKLVVDVLNNDDSSSSGQWGKVWEETALETVDKTREKKDGV